MVFLKDFFEKKVYFENNQQTTRIMHNYPVGKELRATSIAKIMEQKIHKNFFFQNLMKLGNIKVNLPENTCSLSVKK